MPFLVFRRFPREQLAKAGGAGLHQRKLTARVGEGGGDVDLSVAGCLARAPVGGESQVIGTHYEVASGCQPRPCAKQGRELAGCEGCSGTFSSNAYPVGSRHRADVHDETRHGAYCPARAFPSSRQFPTLTPMLTRFTQAYKWSKCVARVEPGSDRVGVIDRAPCNCLTVTGRCGCDSSDVGRLRGSGHGLHHGRNKGGVGPGEQPLSEGNLSAKQKFTLPAANAVSRPATVGTPTTVRPDRRATCRAGSDQMRLHGRHEPGSTGQRRTQTLVTEGKARSQRLRDHL